MKLIVAGLGRTGTQSIGKALGLLGLRTASQRDLMMDAAFGRAALDAVHRRTPMDWSLLDGVDATLGWPLCFLFEEQVARWPQAKVLLNTRDAGAWFESVSRAWPVLSAVRRLPFAPKRAIIDGMAGMLEDRMGGPLDRDTWMAGHDAHIAAVRAGVPAERLVEYPLGAGWEPLCTALDLPVPDAPFPSGNSSANGGFQKTMWRFVRTGRLD